MKKIVALCVPLIVFFSVQLGWTKVFHSVNQTYTTASSPIDVAGSVDGKYTFVLTEGGKVIIYKESGEKEEITVDPAFDKIFVSEAGDKIWLSSKKDNKVQEVFVDFVKQINISDSPFLGEENAPVVITVFSDFQ